MAVRIRGASGKLLAGIRKRKLKQGNPGDIILLDRTRMTRKKGGQRIRARQGYSVEFAIIRDMGMVVDCKFLIHLVAARLMQHYQSSLLKGMRPDGSGPLPELKDNSKNGKYGYGRIQNTMFVRSGELANNWARTKISGTSVRASTKIKPNAGSDPKRNFQINNMGNRKGRDAFDIQSVDGTANKVIADALQEYIDYAMADRNGYVRIPTTYKQGLITLPDIES